jgi:hypothetical protein
MPDTALSRKRQMLRRAILPVHINYGHAREAESALLFQPRRTPMARWPELDLGLKARDFSAISQAKSEWERSAAPLPRWATIDTHI